MAQRILRQLLSLFYQHCRLCEHFTLPSVLGHQILCVYVNVCATEEMVSMYFLVLEEGCYV